MTLLPLCKAMLATLQLAVPVAIPLALVELLIQLTWVTPTLSDAVPATVRVAVVLV